MDNKEYAYILKIVGAKKVLKSDYKTNKKNDAILSSFKIGTSVDGKKTLTKNINGVDKRVPSNSEIRNLLLQHHESNGSHSTKTEFIQSLYDYWWPTKLIDIDIFLSMCLLCKGSYPLPTKRSKTSNLAEKRILFGPQKQQQQNRSGATNYSSSDTGSSYSGSDIEPDIDNPLLDLVTGKPLKSLTSTKSLPIKSKSTTTTTTNSSPKNFSNIEFLSDSDDFGDDEYDEEDDDDQYFEKKRKQTNSFTTNINSKSKKSKKL